MGGGGADAVEGAGGGEGRAARGSRPPAPRNSCC